MVFCISPSVKSHLLDPQSYNNTVTINLHTASQILMSEKPHIHLSGFIRRQICRYWTKKELMQNVQMASTFHLRCCAVCSVLPHGQQSTKDIILKHFWHKPFSTYQETMWIQQDGSPYHIDRICRDVLCEQFSDTHW